MRTGLIALWMLLCSITSAGAQVSVGIGLPGVNIGINFPVYPELVPVPGYPVYYAPQVNSNYFFYDGMYWVYARDNWYASSWYNGPWGLVAPEVVPLYVLRIPVRYYRQPPVYFRGWASNAPPRWDDHWGNSWSQRRQGWDSWNRSAVPAPAPLPAYQRGYSGNRYPRVEQQQVLQNQNYRYQPQETVARQHYQEQRVQSAPTQAPRVQSPPASPPQTRQGVPQERVSAPQDQRSANRQSSVQQGAPPAPHGQPPQNGGANVQRPAVAQAPPQQTGPSVQHQGEPSRQETGQREQQPPRSQGQDKGQQGKGPAEEAKQGQGHEKRD